MVSYNIGQRLTTSAALIVILILLMSSMTFQLRMRAAQVEELSSDQYSSLIAMAGGLGLWSKEQLSTIRALAEAPELLAAASQLSQLEVNALATHPVQAQLAEFFLPLLATERYQGFFCLTRNLPISPHRGYQISGICTR